MVPCHGAGGRASAPSPRARRVENVSSPGVPNRVRLRRPGKPAGPRAPAPSGEASRDTRAQRTCARSDASGSASPRAEDQSLGAPDGRVWAALWSPLRLARPVPVRPDSRRRPLQVPATPGSVSAPCGHPGVWTRAPGCQGSLSPGPGAGRRFTNAPRRNLTLPATLSRRRPWEPRFTEKETEAQRGRWAGKGVLLEVAAQIPGAGPKDLPPPPRRAPPLWPWPLSRRCPVPGGRGAGSGRP